MDPKFASLLVVIFYVASLYGYGYSANVYLRMALAVGMAVAIYHSRSLKNGAEQALLYLMAGVLGYAALVDLTPTADIVAPKKK